jgi:phosphate transport system permease protein
MSSYQQLGTMRQSKVITLNREDFRFRLRRLRSDFFALAVLSTVLVATLMLVVLLAGVVIQGLEYLSFDFLNNFPSRFPEKAGIKSALFGSIWLMGLTTVFVIPLGVAAGIYIEELMAPSWLKSIININLSNLASIPSVVYGIFGLAIFVRFFALDRSLLAGSLTLTCLALPIVIIATKEAIKAIPSSIRLGALALGATQWQTAKDHILPLAAPGICTGVILAISRAIGETAPLILVGAMGFVAFVPEGPMDSFTALPIQIFNWASRPQAEFQGLASAGIIVLLVCLLGLNMVAILIRNRLQKKSLISKI